MTKQEIDSELTELVARFRRLKKAMAEEQTLSPAQRAAAAEAAKYAGALSKSSWGQLRPGSMAGEDEAAKAKQLAKMLESRGILGTRPPPRQPTDQEMFGHLVTPPEKAEQMEKAWGNTMNNWMAEVTKPLNARFKSKEEEAAYWDSIKITDSGSD